MPPVSLVDEPSPRAACTRSSVRIRLTAALVALLATFGFAHQTAAQTRVLFLGNSYTGVNDLPAMFQELAFSGGHVVVRDANTPGGKTLGSNLQSTPHMSLQTSLDKIALGGWDYVVLQEQSVTPMINATKNLFMLPGVQSLDGSIKASNPTAVTLLYQTWARRDPGVYCWGPYCSASFASFEQGQDKITLSYSQSAASVSADVAPVGEAWRLYRQENPAGNLFAADGSHPNVSGTYLAACVFYAALFDESPVGVSYAAGLSGAQAALLQDIAARTVFGNPPDPWQDLGGSTVGSNGAVTLTGSGTLVGGTAAGLELSNAPPGATTLAWLSFSSSPQGFFGGTLHATPVTNQFLFGADGAGEVSVATTWPVGVPAGTDAWFQFLAADPSVVWGITLSNALKVTTP